jgi:hypothetical protein
MMLTELYYYYANHQTAKAATQSAFNVFPTGIRVACTAGKPFAVIGTHFNRDYSTVIHECHLIEQRTQRDAAFRLFIEKLEGRTTRTFPTTEQA